MGAVTAAVGEKPDGTPEAPGSMVVVQDDVLAAMVQEYDRLVSAEPDEFWKTISAVHTRSRGVSLRAPLPLAETS